MSDEVLPRKVFFLDEWGSEEHMAEVAAGRPWAMVDRAQFEGRQPPLSDQPAEWPEGWIEMGATTDDAELRRLFRR